MALEAKITLKVVLTGGYIVCVDGDEPYTYARDRAELKQKVIDIIEALTVNEEQQHDNKQQQQQR